MKKRLLITTLSLFTLSSNVLASGVEGEQLLKSMCAQCHVMSGVSRVAPPLIAVKMHVKKAYKSREDFVQRIVDWVEDPDEAIALMPGAIRKFGLMPKLSYDSEDVEKIAEYLYDNEIKGPKWYKKHFEGKHGKN